MIIDPLLSDDLPALLRAFPSDALRGLVEIVKKHSSWSPFPAPRAYEAHVLSNNVDFAPHANAIAREILWWGSNELHRQIGEDRGWQKVVSMTAAQIGVPKEQRMENLTAWQIEGAVLQKTLEDWEKISPEQRGKALQKTGLDLSAVKGGILATAGGVAGLGGQQLLSFLAARGASFTLAATVFAPVATVLGVAWATYELAGPGYRVLRPAVLSIALTRQRLRDERITAAFGD
jgi:uncharacterized protein YaaW (UPF0174 family)